MILAALCIVAQALPTIIPAPVSYKELSGEFELGPKTVIVAEGAARPVADRLRGYLQPATGYDFFIDRRPQPKSIELRIDPQEQSLGDEGYKLDVSPAGITIRALKPNGLFYGVQTLRQILPVQIYESKARKNFAWRVPGCEVMDTPRLAWRGMMLDVSRHFYGPKFIKEFIDWLAMHKMNSFHWHLTDDGGWRIEIKKYPKLTEVGAWRQEQVNEWDGANLHFPGKDSGKKLYGGFYTQKEIREIVKYAADRYITIVPEIEMPGHSTEAMASYPELMCSPSADVLANYIRATGNEFPSMVCAGKESVTEFYENVLAEIIDLFPSKFIHIGGDEVPKDLWAQCADCQARMQKEGLKNVEELQSSFVHRIDKWLSDHGRRLLGWDEILEGGLAPGATVMSWRGTSGGIAAAQSNHDVVMSPTSHCYFDYPYTTTSTEHVYSYEPIPGELNEAQGQRVMGAQANIWTEWLSSEEEIESMMFPRAAALSEVVWTKFEKKDWDDFSRRMLTHYQRLDALGINYYIDAPMPKAELVQLNGPQGVEFEKPQIPNGVIRYTIDNTEPKVGSPLYSGPIRLNRGGVVKAATFRPNGTRSEIVSVPVVMLKSDESPKVAGVTRSVINQLFRTCPEPSAFVNGATKNVTEIGLGELSGDNFAIQFEGFIRIPEDGEYTFYLGSDDGSKMWLGDSLVVDNDGLHAYNEKRLKLLLPKGDYPFRVIYFEQGGAESLRLFVETKTSTKQLVPSSMLWSK